MRVGVLGSGDVAQALAAGFVRHGHEVTMGTRDASKLATFAKEHSGVRVGSFADAAKSGDVLVLAVKGSAVFDVIKAAGAANFSGKTVLDPTNPIAERAPKDGVIYPSVASDESLMMQLQREFPEAHFVKAFSCVGSATMVDPKFRGGKPSMFICGNDDRAKKTVASICEQFGWEVEDMGTAEAARAIEPLALLWCIPGFLQDDWGLRAFKMMR